jgi:predicted YcjX-like family ATPase
VGAGLPALPALTKRLGGRRISVRLAPAHADAIPRFDPAPHLAALAGDPPAWPARTGAVSLLAFDIESPRTFPLPPRRLRLELLDYPGEWLLDLPLLRSDFAAWSAATLRRLEARPAAREFLAFATALPAAARDEALAVTGHRLYRAALGQLRDGGHAFLQPGRFLMPAPGPEPPWMQFFPLNGSGRLAALLAERYDAYVDAVRRDIVSPLFGDLDRLVVLADLLSALHAGPDSFADAQAALAAASGALRWQWSWADAFEALRNLRLPPRVIRRVAYAATKADHVADRQRGNLAALMASLAPGLPGGVQPTAHFAIASIRCTEDATMTLDGRPVSAVRGRTADGAMVRSYPGEVPSAPPDAAFWNHPFFQLPEFEPTRLPANGRAGVPQLNVDALLAFLLDDLL